MAGTPRVNFLCWVLWRKRYMPRRAPMLPPYFCMGFTMLSLMTEDGFVTVHECDTIVLDDDGRLYVEK